VAYVFVAVVVFDGVVLVVMFDVDGAFAAVDCIVSVAQTIERIVGLVAASVGVEIEKSVEFLVVAVFVAAAVVDFDLNVATAETVDRLSFYVAESPAAVFVVVAEEAVVRSLMPLKFLNHYSQPRYLHYS